MNIARLTDNIRTDLGDRFILYYGNVNDEFCDVDLVIGSIDFMLWRYLREQGYKRVVFFNGARNLHFYDNESKKNCLADNAKSSKDNHGNSSLKGPLGFRSLLQNANYADKQEENLTSSSSNCSSGGVKYETRQQQSRMTDLNALDIMDHIFNERGNSVPTALVFTMVEDLINFQGSSFREIQNRMIDWIRGPSDTTNICIFISQKSTLEDVQKFAEDYNLHIINNFIREKGGDQVNIIKIGFPDKTEISSTINRHRLLKGVKVDWQIFKNVTNFLERQKLPIKRLNAMFCGIGELNKETLLNWNRKKSICSTEYLIENIEKDNNLLNIDEIRKRFDTIYDQEENIELLIYSLQSWHGLMGKRHPLSFFLVGTSGVGKSYTSELLAEALQPLGYEHCYFAMSEFMQEHTVSNLIGSPRGYVGSEEEPKLFEALKKSSKLVICFDEIEKAHEKVRLALMQLLDKGYLSWSKGEGDFRDCIIFMNSNAKKKELVEMKKKYLQIGKSIDGPEFQNAVRDILTKDGFPSELCGRLNSLLVYNPLSPEAVIRIAKQEIGKLAADYGLEVGFIEPALLAEIAEKTAETEYGARPIKDAVAYKLGKEFAALGQTQVNGTKSVDVVFSAGGYKVTPAVKDQKEFPQDDLLEQSITIYQDKSFDRSFIDAGKITEHFKSVYCQEDNIKQLISSLEIWYAQVKKRHPLSFFLVGTSGVGKSYTTELLAEALQPLGYEHCYFAMSEFMQEHTVSNLIGSPRGYVGSEEEPKLFEALKNSSKLVICFDEIEKAHEKVRVALMQLLDKGYLSWSKGEGDFRDCIIFMNSNAKKKELVEMKKKYLQTGKSIDGPEFQNAVRDILTKDGFPSELCGRLNSLLVYNPLSPEAVIRIAKQEIDKLAADYGLEVGFIEPALLAEIAEKTAETEYGARPIKDNVAKKLGKLLIKARKDRVNDKIAINKTDQGYSIDPASQNNKAVSDEEIIRQSETIVSTMQTESSSKSNNPDGKPKRILKLSELPTMIREELKTDASASEPTIINSVNPAVGYVEIEDFAGEQSSGSGFVITPEGIMITCFHVVENAQKIMVRFDTSPGVLFPASFIDGDKDADIALLQLEGKGFPYALLAPYGERVEIGEKVGLLGYPLGEDLGQLTTYTSGVLSSYRSLFGQGGPLLYQIDAGAYHGSSGGPLIRIRDGRVIGILAGGRKEVSQFNFAISSNEIFKRLVSEY